MVELLQYVLSDASTFFGTLALIIMTGIAGRIMLGPLSGPRTYVSYYEVKGGEDGTDQD